MIPKYRSGSTTSRSSTPGNVQNAALAGAALAFAKSSKSAALSLSSNQGENGVLPANGRPPALPRSSTSSPTRTSTIAHSRQSRAGEDIIGEALTSTPSRTPSTASGHSVCTQASVDSNLAQSYSYKAANIATGTYTPNTSRAHSPRISIASSNTGGRDVAGTQANRRHPGLVREEMHKPERVGNMQERTDITSIPATASLVKMFEQQPDAGKGTKPAVGRKPSFAKGKPPPIVAPKPQRTILLQDVSPELPPESVKPLPNLLSKPRIGTPKRRGTDLAETTSPSSVGTGLDSGNAPGQRPDLPPPRRSSKQPAFHEKTSEPSKSPSPRRRSLAPPVFQQPARLQSQSPGFQIRRDLPFNPNRPSPAPYNERSAKEISPSMTGDSLANAMVGASLALSNSPRKAKTPPPLPAPRRKGHHHMTDNLLHRSRSLSPIKKNPMSMGTLRAEVADKDKGFKKHRLRQPNKHHEGTRERWRDEVTIEEIKRYEGVWAANKGLHVSAYWGNETAAMKEEVQNVVVRDIWSRSRLPPERLSTVWNLVVSAGNREDTGRLTKEQFVVGMWLIDQCLNGRNLPHSIPSSVWTSVQLRGVKIRLEGKGQDGRKLRRGAQW